MSIKRGFVLSTIYFVLVLTFGEASLMRMIAASRNAKIGHSFCEAAQQKKGTKKSHPSIFDILFELSRFLFFFLTFDEIGSGDLIVLLGDLVFEVVVQTVIGQATMVHIEHLLIVHGVVDVLLQHFLR